MMVGPGVLTEEEAEALMEGLDEGRVRLSPSGLRRHVEPYDFSTQPSRIGIEAAGLELVQERLQRVLGSSLGKLLGARLLLSPEDPRLTDFADSLTRLPTRSSFHIGRIPSERCLLGVALEADLVYVLADLFLGGDGELPPEGHSREFSATERRVLRLVVEAVLAAHAEAWSLIAPMEAEYVTAEDRPELSGYFEPDEQILVSRFRVSVEERGGVLELMLPFSVAEAHRSRLASPKQQRQEIRDEQWRRRLVDGLMEVPLTLRGRFADARIPLARVLALRAGDVLTLDTPAEVRVFAADVPVCRAAYGVHRGQAALQLRGRLMEAAAGVVGPEPGEADGE